MAVKMGTLTTGTGTSDVVVTGVGFTPKAIIFWGPNAIGVAVSTSNRWSVGNSNSGNNVAAGSNDCCFYTIDTAGKLDLKSYDTDGFTLAVDDAFSSSLTVGYLAVSAGNWDAGVLTEPGSTGNQSVTGLSFAPSTIITGSAGLTAHNTPTAASCLSMGAAQSSSKRFVNVQYGSESGADCGTCDNYSQGRTLWDNTACFASTYATWNSAPLSYADFVSMNSGGFTVNWLARWRSNYHYWVATDLPGLSMGSFQTRTDTNDIVVSGIAAKPQAVMFFGGGKTFSWSWANNASQTVGGCDSASNRYYWAGNVSDGFSYSSAGDPYTTNSSGSSLVYEEYDSNGTTLISQMDIKSMDQSGFTCVMDDVDTSSKDIVYLGFPSGFGGNQVIWC